MKEVQKKNVDQLKVELHKKIIELLKSNGVESEIIDAFSVDKVLIDVRDNSVAGVIPCILCGSSKMFRINTKIQGEERLYWTVSNFQTHLTDIHKIKTTQIRKKVSKKVAKSSKSQNDPDSSDGFDFEAVSDFGTKKKKVPGLNDGDTNECVNADQKNVPNSQKSDTSIKIETHSEYSESKEFDKQRVRDNDDFESSTCIELQIEPSDRTECASIEDLETKIYEQISKQSIKMIEISLQNKENVEAMDLIHSDKTYNLNVVTISPDGNCLIGAMVHQIVGHKLLSKEHELAVIRLRVDVVKFLNDNLKRFEFELKNRIYNMKEKQIQKGVKRKVKIENFEEEAKKFLCDYLSKDAFWCGSETIKAVSLMHNVNILTIQENGTGSIQTLMGQ